MYNRPFSGAPLVGASCIGLPLFYRHILSCIILSNLNFCSILEVFEAQFFLVIVHMVTVICLVSWISIFIQICIFDDESVFQDLLIYNNATVLSSKRFSMCIQSVFMFCMSLLYTDLQYKIIVWYQLKLHKRVFFFFFYLVGSKSLAWQAGVSKRKCRSCTSCF